MPDSTATMTRPSGPSARPQSNGVTSPLDPLDGYTEVDLPSVRHMRVLWDIDIIDPEGDPHDRIIEANDPFKVVIRVQLKGRLWSCVSADWWFDLGFSPVGAGTGFNLSTYVPEQQLWQKGWPGCGGYRSLELEIPVPANTIPTERCGTVYQCTGRFEMYCCGKPAGVAGFEPLGQYDFYSPVIED
ncbi:MAG TPA: hypothetical protein VGH76_06495 [Actinomycetospora sp.]|jgi:hypothetical protein|uniref:hypothetical protein n=1 Tax=Actinomycetospora sp. TaxID=1872135 RepID=UPI002F42B8AF